MCVESEEMGSLSCQKIIHTGSGSAVQGSRSILVSGQISSMGFIYMSVLYKLPL